MKEQNYDSGRSASAVLMMCETLEEYVLERGETCDTTLYDYVTSVCPKVKAGTMSRAVNHYDWITVRSPLSASERSALEKELKPDGVLYVIGGT